MDTLREGLPEDLILVVGDYVGWRGFSAVKQSDEDVWKYRHKWDTLIILKHQKLSHDTIDMFYGEYIPQQACETQT